MKDKMLAFMMMLGENQWWDSDRLRGRSDACFRDVLQCEKKAWREIAHKAVEHGFNTVFIATVDGVKYKSHPELAVKGAWEVEELKEELNYFREIGLTPIPELNFSTAHDIWLGEYSRKVSTPQYYQVVRDVIHENIEIFDYPELFMLDMDEEKALNQGHLDFVCYRQYDLLWHDIKFILDCVREKGVRPWMYVDVFARYPEKFLENVDKDVVISPWYYKNFYEDVETKLPKLNDPDDPGNYNEFLLAKLDSYTALPKLGYDVIPVCSNCFNEYNIDHTIRYSIENIPDDKLMGIGVAPWCGTTTDANKYGFFKSFAATKEALDKYGKEGKL